MSQLALQWVVALGVGAIFAELIRSGFQRRKMSADAAKVITDAATVLLGPLQSRVRELEGEVALHRHELEAAHAQISTMSHELLTARTEVHELRLQLQSALNGPGPQRRPQ